MNNVVIRICNTIIKQLSCGHVLPHNVPIIKTVSANRDVICLVKLF